MADGIEDFEEQLPPRQRPLSAADARITELYDRLGQLKKCEGIRAELRRLQEQMAAAFGEVFDEEVRMEGDLDEDMAKADELLERARKK